MLCQRSKVFRDFGGLGGKVSAPHRGTQTPCQRSAVPSLAAQRRRQYGRARTTLHTENRARPSRRARFGRRPRTIPHAPNRRARFDPRERTEAAATNPKKKLYVNARASAGQGLATTLSKRGREPPAKLGARRDSFKRPLNAA